LKGLSSCLFAPSRTSSDRAPRRVTPSTALRKWVGRTGAHSNAFGHLQSGADPDDRVGERGRLERATGDLGGRHAMTDPVSVDQGAVALRWRERGFSCGLWADEPGQEWIDYVHQVDEIVMVVEGDVEFVIDGQVHHPLAGDELLIPARARHTVRNLGSRTSRWLFGYRR